jgi:UDP-N-acetylglucosamine 2-epimerase (non-hydrolysing)
VLTLFDIDPDRDLDCMQPDQALAELTSRLIIAIDDVFRAERPDIVLAQGDTTTVMAAALCCFYRRIAFGHVEAGLRTGDIYYPFPEEINRTIASRIAKWHFAPTERARTNLLQEGIPSSKIFVTGNTVIDALLQVADGLDCTDSGLNLDPGKRIILVTAHRRENFGEPMRQICQAIRTIADRNPDVQIVYPVHRNPNVTGPVSEILEGHPRIILCSPVDYRAFVALMKKSYLILSDSGGIQEEAPALSKPVLVLRNETERPEAVEMGVVKLVGYDFDNIVKNTQQLLHDSQSYSEMAKGISPYGDGNAADRILRTLKKIQ